MSFYQPAGANPAAYDPTAVGRRPRPGTVTVAGLALFACAALAVVGAIASFAVSNTVATNADALALQDQSNVNSGQALMIGYGVISLVVAIPYLICGIFVLRGRQGMRITTWVYAGLSVLCLGFYALGSGAASVDTSALGSSDTDQLIAHAIPNWYFASTATLESITVLLAIVVIILIALPSSNQYFRRSTGFLMPGGYAVAYPAYPGAYPGYTVPATAYPAAAYPAGAYPAGAYPDGTYPAGAYPAGAYPAGAYPAGAYPAYPGYLGYPAEAGPPDIPGQVTPPADPSTFAPAPTLMDPAPSDAWAPSAEPPHAESPSAESPHAEPPNAGPPRSEPPSVP